MSATDLETPAGAPPEKGAPQAGASGAGSSRLWLWVLAAFALQLAAWTAWFIIALHHQVEEVPLAHAR